MEEEFNPKEDIQVTPAVTDEQVDFRPSDKEQQVVRDVIEKFRRSRDDRNRNFLYFDGINIIDYINDSVSRFTTNIDERDNLEDWQARINNQFTRNKVITILGKVSAVLPIANFTGRGSEDVRKGILLNNLYEYSEDIDNYEEKMTQILLEAIVKGTAIGYEGMERKEKIIRNVTGSGDNIKETSQKEIKTKLFGKLIPLEEFYPSSVGIRNIDDMPYCFWRRVITLSEFKAGWSQYERHELVQPKQSHVQDEEEPFYMDFISDDVSEGNVELIRSYDKETDQFVIIANGLWLNPIKSGDTIEIISPMPFNHKELPFWQIKFDFFGDFFYGKSLPDKLKAMQDVLNVLTNMMLDQSFLTIFPPLLTNGYDSIEDDYLRPGRRTPVDTQGLPLNQAFMKLDLGTPSGWHQFILGYTEKIMQEASIDQVSSGQPGVGGRTTAEEIRTAAEGVASTLSIFGRQINMGIKRKATLRGANILQYWTNKETPMIQRIGGDGAVEEFNKVFNTFEIDGAALTRGKRGVKIIELYGDKKDIPTKKELTARAMVASASAEKSIEIDALPGEYLRNLSFDVKLVANAKSETNKDLEKALQLEKVRVYMSFFPNLVNTKELAAQTAEKMGDDPTKVLNDEVFQPPVEPGSEQDNGVSTNPTENNANNLTRSARGGEQGMASLAALQGGMLG